MPPIATYAGMPARSLALVVALVTGGCMKGVSTGTVTMSADRFAGGATVVKLQKMRVHLFDAAGKRAYPMDGFGIHASGREWSADFLLDTYSFNNWTFLECHVVRMLADNTPLPVGESTHSGTPVGGNVIEYIEFSVDRSALEAMRAASTVEIEVCGRQAKLNAAQMKVLHTFIDRTFEHSPTP
jgi:hypothetical protein